MMEDEPKYTYVVVLEVGEYESVCHVMNCFNNLQDAELYVACACAENKILRENGYYKNTSLDEESFTCYKIAKVKMNSDPTDDTEVEEKDYESDFTVKDPRYTEYLSKLKETYKDIESEKTKVVEYPKYIPKEEHEQVRFNLENL